MFVVVESSVVSGNGAVIPVSIRSKLSALTHQLLGQAKTVVILLTGHFFFSSTLTILQIYGVCVCAREVLFSFDLLQGPCLPWGG